MLTEEDGRDSKERELEKRVGVEGMKMKRGNDKSKQYDSRERSKIVEVRQKMETWGVL